MGGERVAEEVRIDAGGQTDPPRPLPQTGLDGPRAERLSAPTQEKGVQVEILNVTEYEGEKWYLIDAPTGEGWVPAENILTEAP